VEKLKNVKITDTLDRLTRKRLLTLRLLGNKSVGGCVFLSFYVNEKADVPENTLTNCNFNGKNRSHDVGYVVCMYGKIVAE
jgi:hypothetical protein